MLSIELASKIVESQYTAENKIFPEASVLMREVNALLNYNNSLTWDNKFPEQDIRFTEFLENFVQTQYQKDISIVQEFFHMAYSILFNTILTMKKEPNKSEQDTVKKVYNALYRLNKPLLLTEGLPDSIVKKYCIDE